MKFRKDMVTNSSSTCFIVENYKDKCYNGDFDYFEHEVRHIEKNIFKKAINTETKVLDLSLIPGIQTEFGWQWIKYDEPFNKICWLVLQCQRGESIGGWGNKETIEEARKMNSEYLHELIDLLNRKIFSSIDYQIEDIICSKGFIDHQSINYDIKWPSQLDRFIFDINCYVQCGNDNTSIYWGLDRDENDEEDDGEDDDDENEEVDINFN